MNWSQYNKELGKRASIEIYFSEEVIRNWYGEARGESHRPRRYSDTAIETCLLIKHLFRQGYRQTEQIVGDIIKLLRKEILDIPHYSQINRRQGDLDITGIIKQAKRSGKIIAIDATGISLYSPQMWNKQKHRCSQNEKWLKLHGALDVESGELVDYELTDSKTSDSETAQKMLEEGNLSEVKVKELLGDGAYDNKNLYSLLYKRGIKPNFRIRKDAMYSETSPPYLRWRDNQVKQAFLDKFIYSDNTKRDLLRRRRLENGYGRRSLIESFFSRFKNFFGDKFSSYKPMHIKKELAIKILFLNSSFN